MQEGHGRENEVKILTTFFKICFFVSYSTIVAVHAFAFSDDHFDNWDHVIVYIERIVSWKKVQFLVVTLTSNLLWLSCCNIAVSHYGALVRLKSLSEHFGLPTLVWNNENGLKCIKTRETNIYSWPFYLKQIWELDARNHSESHEHALHAERGSGLTVEGGFFSGCFFFLRSDYKWTPCQVVI